MNEETEIQGPARTLAEGDGELLPHDGDSFLGNLRQSWPHLRNALFRSGRRGRRVFLGSLLFSAVVVIVLETLTINYGWLRTWFPDIHQLWIILINPGTVLAVVFAGWSQLVLRRTGSTRLSAMALFTCILVGFAILTYIATVHRGPNWDFYWSESQWPVH